MYLAQDVCYTAPYEDTWYRNRINETTRAILESHYLLEDAQQNGDMVHGHLDLISPEFSITEEVFHNVLAQYLANIMEEEARSRKRYEEEMDQESDQESEEESKEGSTSPMPSTSSMNSEESFPPATIIAKDRTRAERLGKDMDKLFDPVVRNFRELARLQSTKS